MVGRPDMRPRGIVATLVVCVALLVSAPAALAASVTQDAYCQGCGVVHHASKSSIPFTGLDVALVVAAGAALLAAGFGVRRISRNDIA
jgi:hypothetical protein